MRNYLIQFIKLWLCFAIAYLVSLFSMEYIITNPDENTMLIVFYGTVCCLILGEFLRSNDGFIPSIIYTREGDQSRHADNTRYS